jgi:hypothetical protein
VVNVTRRPLFTPGKDTVPIVQKAVWTPGPVWTGAENLTLTGIRSPDRSARSSVGTPSELPGQHQFPKAGDNTEYVVEDVCSQNKNKLLP